MVTDALVYLALMPVYFGWVLSLAGPFVMLALILPLMTGGAVWHRLSPFWNRKSRILRPLKTSFNEIPQRNPIVNLKEVFPALQIHNAHPRSGPVRGREVIGRKLLIAQRHLPTGLNLVVFNSDPSRCPCDPRVHAQGWAVDVTLGAPDGGDVDLNLATMEQREALQRAMLKAGFGGGGGQTWWHWYYFGGQPYLQHIHQVPESCESLAG